MKKRLLPLVFAAVMALAVPARAAGTAPTMAPFDPANAPPNAAIGGGSAELLVQVTDEGGNTMSGVTVALQERSNATETDENGLVLLQDLTPGVGYEIFVIAEAYQEWTDVYTCPEQSQQTPILSVCLGSAGGTVSAVPTGAEDADRGETPSGSPTGAAHRWLLAAFLVLLALVALLLWQLYKSWNEGEPWQPPQEPDTPGKVIDIDWEDVDENGTENE